MNNRWRINRIGLVNFWYYDEEEFEFSGGRLLLRGANGSGKSVTMQSFIPLLLDGNKSPERLDPFGSRARKLEDYLLGEEELGEEERTGYLYMEFLKEGSGNSLTLGIGLHARRGKALDFWSFALTDGRRVGRDFFLYKDLGEKVPLSKQELKNRIGAGGEVHERQGDYMEMVNNLLFGFEDLEDYDELIKLLVQLRTPKLSKSRLTPRTGPACVCEAHSRICARRRPVVSMIRRTTASPTSGRKKSRSAVTSTARSPSGDSRARAFAWRSSRTPSEIRGP